MMAPSVLWGVLAQLLVVAMAPQITFPFIVNLFTVFAFGMLWLSLREAAAVWILTVVASRRGAVPAPGRISAWPPRTRSSSTLSWLFCQ